MNQPKCGQEVFGFDVTSWTGQMITVSFEAQQHQFVFTEAGLKLTYEYV